VGRCSRGIVSTDHNTTRTGHWLALGIPAGHWIDWRYRGSDPAGTHEFGRFAAQVRATGGIAVAAHPHAPCLGCSWGFGYDDVDAIEVWNGPWTADDEVSLADWDALLHRDGWRGGQWTPAIGNSDAHWVRAEIRRLAPTTTAPDTMVALTNPIFLRPADEPAGTGSWLSRARSDAESLAGENVGDEAAAW
jgi:hypothetical protein